jgi:hypothetical protein
LESGDVQISWQIPSENGSPVSAYSISIQEPQSLDYSAYSGCDLQTAISSQLCIIPFSQLQAIPWFIDGGDSIWVQIIATNDFGPSEASTGNGAVFTRIPDAPVSLIENLASKTDTSIDLEW